MGDAIMRAGGRAGAARLHSSPKREISRAVLNATPRCGVPALEASRERSAAEANDVKGVQIAQRTGVGQVELDIMVHGTRARGRARSTPIPHRNATQDVAFLRSRPPPRGARAGAAGAKGVQSARRNRKSPTSSSRWGFYELTRQRPTLPHTHACSTIGSGGLNFRVRDGIGCGPSDIATGNFWKYESSDRPVGALRGRVSARRRALTPNPGLELFRARTEVRHVDVCLRGRSSLTAD